MNYQLLIVSDMIVMFEYSWNHAMMGFKSLLLLIFLIFVVLFSIQNLQSISLVFFGFNSLSLPLSIWIVITLAGGIISSLFIQLLTRNPKSNQNNYYNPPADNPIQPDYPPSAQQQVAPARNDNFSSSRVTKSTTRKVDDGIEDQFDIFDDRQWGEEEKEAGWVENQPPRVTNPEVKVSAPPPPITPPVTPPVTTQVTPPIYTQQEEENQSDYIPPNTVKQVIPEDDYSSQSSFAEDSLTQNEKVSPTTPLTPPTPSTPPTPPEDNTPSPSLLKNREASLYSYQSKEKTVFREQPLPRLEKKQKQRNDRTTDSADSDRNEKTSTPRSNQIYDAPFRVIAPRKNPPPPPSKPKTDIDDDWVDDDDWDF